MPSPRWAVVWCAPTPRPLPLRRRGAGTPLRTMPATQRTEVRAGRCAPTPALSPPHIQPENKSIFWNSIRDRSSDAQIDSNLLIQQISPSPPLSLTHTHTLSLSLFLSPLHSCLLFIVFFPFIECLLKRKLYSCTHTGSVYLGWLETFCRSRKAENVLTS